MKNGTTVLILMPVLFAGCASTKDIDLSKVEPKCGQSCSANYSECLSKFSVFPLERQHECTTALRLCAQACPAR
jgi:hypothetical protein